MEYFSFIHICNLYYIYVGIHYSNLYMASLYEYLLLYFYSAKYRFHKKKFRYEFVHVQHKKRQKH